MKKEEFRFTERLRVRWAEIDAQKIVFNAHYLTYIDTANLGYWRALALPYAQAMERLGGDLYLRKATLEYHASALCDDVLDVGMRCLRVGSSSIVFSAAVLRREQLLVGGELVYVFADPATQRSKPVPDTLRELLLRYEEGGAVLEVQTGGWDALRDRAQPIRRAAFVEELGISAERESDPADATAIHALACNRLGMALATGRLVLESEGIGRIGRIAVVAGMRNAGIGRAVLDALLAEARKQGCREASLQAQLAAAPLYRRAGFVEAGAPYEEAGVAHLDMRRVL